MAATVAIIAALFLFLLGLRLSAFFSGAETGFYRVSFPRLMIDAQAGDRTAKRLLWFAQNPSYFVATTLVGNNVANYLTTVAIGLAAVSMVRGSAGSIEIVATLLVSPVVFVFGELVPKHLYYRAPLRLLVRDARWFILFYRLLLVFSFPLIAITKLLERVGGSGDRSLELMLGRSRLVNVLQRGHQEGLLTDAQNRMINGLLHTASQRLDESVIPPDRVLGVAATTSRKELLEHARKYGLTNVAVHAESDLNIWYGYVRVIDAAVSRRSLASVIRRMPRVESSSSKLEALLILRESHDDYGAVYDGNTFVGIVAQRGLVEQLFRSRQVPAGRFRLPA